MRRGGEGEGERGGGDKDGGGERSGEKGQRRRGGACVEVEVLEHMRRVVLLCRCACIGVHV